MVMETDLREAMASGVFVEFCDQHGKCRGQAVFLDWRGRPLPAVGDTFCCHAAEPGTGRGKKMRGRVRTRQFDIQVEDCGASSIWVRLELELIDRGMAASTQAPAPQRRVTFSLN